MMFLNVDLKIIHRDLRGENIFLNRDYEGVKIKIGNFGRALHNLSSEDSRRFDVGTLNFMVKFILNLVFTNFKSHMIATNKYKFHLVLRRSLFSLTPIIKLNNFELFCILCTISFESELLFDHVHNQ